MTSNTPSTAAGKASPFFFAYAVTLLLLVVGGFAPSLFVRFAFDPPPIPLYLHLHGIILTGWFALLVLQAALIRGNNPALHRRLGYFFAAYAVLVVIGGLMATVNAVARGLATGLTFDTSMADINPAMGGELSYLAFMSGVVWANIASVIGFSILVGLAIARRRDTATHKRLILVASAGLMGPALARISRLELLGGEQGPFMPIAMLSLLGAILLHDKLTLGKVHRASLAGVILTLALAVASIAIAGSDGGQAFVAGLANP